MHDGRRYDGRRPVFALYVHHELAVDDVIVSPALLPIACEQLTDAPHHAHAPHSARATDRGTAGRTTECRARQQHVVHALVEACSSDK